MAAMTLDGTTIPIDQLDVEVQSLGEGERAFDGSLRLYRKGFKRLWRVRTKTIPSATAVTIRDLVLDLTNVITLAGDVVSGESDDITVIGETISEVYAQAYSGGAWDNDMRVLTFSLREL